MQSKLGIYVFTGSANMQRCEFINSTWGKDRRVMFFTDLEGGVNLPENFISACVKGGYRSHLEKNAFAIEWAYHNDIQKFDWFLFIGDDNFVYPDNIERDFSKIDHTKPACYGQIQNCWPQDKSLYYALGGAGQMFSKAGLIKFVKEGPRNLVDFFNNGEYSDVQAGLIMRDINLDLINTEGFYSQPPDHYGITKPEDYYVFHYIKSEEDFLKLNSLKGL